MTFCEFSEWLFLLVCRACAESRLCSELALWRFHCAHQARLRIIRRRFVYNSPHCVMTTSSFGRLFCPVDTFSTLRTVSRPSLTACVSSFSRFKRVAPYAISPSGCMAIAIMCGKSENCTHCPGTTVSEYSYFLSATVAPLQGVASLKSPGRRMKNSAFQPLNLAGAILTNTSRSAVPVDTNSLVAL